MLKRKNISIEESLKRACEENGLVYKKDGNNQRTTITLIDESGKETVVSRNMEIVKPVKTYVSTPVSSFQRVASSARGTIARKIASSDAAWVGGASPAAGRAKTAASGNTVVGITKTVERSAKTAARKRKASHRLAAHARSKSSHK